MIDSLYQCGMKPSSISEVLNVASGSSGKENKNQSCIDHLKTSGKSNIGHQCIGVIKYFQDKTRMLKMLIFSLKLN